MLKFQLERYLETICCTHAAKKDDVSLVEHPGTFLVWLLWRLFSFLSYLHDRQTLNMRIRWLQFGLKSCLTYFSMNLHILQCWYVACFEVRELFSQFIMTPSWMWAIRMDVCWMTCSSMGAKTSQSSRYSCIMKSLDINIFMYTWADLHTKISKRIYTEIYYLDNIHFLFYGLLYDFDPNSKQGTCQDHTPVSVCVSL